MPSYEVIVQGRISELTIKSGSGISFVLTSTISKPHAGTLKDLRLRFRGRWVHTFITRLTEEGIKSDAIAIAFTLQQLQQHGAFLAEENRRPAAFDQSDYICFEECLQCWLLGSPKGSTPANEVVPYE